MAKTMNMKIVANHSKTIDPMILPDNLCMVNNANMIE